MFVSTGGAAAPPAGWIGALGLAPIFSTHLEYPLHAARWAFSILATRIFDLATSPSRPRERRDSTPRRSRLARAFIFGRDRVPADPGRGGDARLLEKSR